jgi:hypothetical protein
MEELWIFCGSFVFPCRVDVGLPDHQQANKQKASNLPYGAELRHHKSRIVDSQIPKVDPCLVD